MRIQRVSVTNYRALRRVELGNLTPLTVLLGPNGSGKSTVFDVFSFLSDCFSAEGGLMTAWDRRGRFRELRSRGSAGPIVIELQYSERDTDSPATYHLAIDEEGGRPIVVEEWLKWRRVGPNEPGAPYLILNFKRGSGYVISGERPEKDDKKVRETLDEPHLLAASTLGRLKSNQRVAALRRFITSWYVSYLSASEARNQPDAGAQEHLSKTGDNLANVIQYLKDRHPDVLEQIFSTLRERVPRIEKVESDETRDGKLLLLIKDAPFKDPILARWASDGTLKMLAYLVVLHDPSPAPFIGVEEPENFLHPRLLPELAEECIAATERSQLLVTTHSPFFLNGLQPEQVRVIERDSTGFTTAQRVADITGISQFVEHGAKLGQLWMEGRLGGDPLRPVAASRAASRRRSGR